MLTSKTKVGSYPVPTHPSRHGVKAIPEHRGGS
jgi:hypothetical protein